MNLLPQPQKLTVNAGSLLTKAFRITNLCADVRIQKALERLPRSADGAELTVSCAAGSGEGYTLEVSENCVTIVGESAVGAFYGIQTLRQLLEAETVPCLKIEDCPDMRYRGFYHDVTRGKVPTVQTLKSLIDTLAYYKMNELQLYVEHTFPFRELENVENFGYLTAEEIRELDDYCWENFIDFVPSIATFGHLYELLQQEKYRHLQCLENFEDDRVFWIGRMLHHTVDPVNPESFRLITSLIDQYLPLFRSDRFNICCDETFDLTDGRHKDEDTGKLYTEFVLKLIDYVKAKGKKVMMWGDIILKHPETVTRLPRDIQFLNWTYNKDPKEENVAFFEAAGCRQIVCPGTGTWNRLVERIDYSGQNITKLLDYGFDHGAEGVLNTNWGDYGNPCALELSLYCTVLGAAKSWNKKTQQDAAFEESMIALQYKHPKAVEALRVLDQASMFFQWKRLVWYYSNVTKNSELEILCPEEEPLRAAHEACLSLAAELETQTWEREEYREELLLSARGIALMTELFSKIAGYSLPHVTSTEAWLRDYRRRWLRSNKESELARIETMFRTLEQNLYQ